MRSELILALSAIGMPLAALAQVPPSAAPAQPAQEAKFTKTEAEAVVRELATQLEENFLFPDIGKKYASMLRSKLAAGAYGGFSGMDLFAEAVTKDLQAVHADGHLRVHVVPQEARLARGGEMRGPPPTLNAIAKSGWLADGIAYIDFRGFPGTEATMTALRTFLDAHKDARTLIIDARKHGGGGLDEMDTLFPALFENETFLVGMDTRLAVEQRMGSPVEGQASLRKVQGPEGVVRREHWVTPAANRTGLEKAKVYLLTSNRTASAAEHLALSLKRTRRATLIGETTRGAGHYGGMIPIGHGFAVFIPVGQTYDPDTNQGWEGTGVKPHIEVAADRALDEALRLAGVNLSGEAALAQLK